MTSRKLKLFVATFIVLDIYLQLGECQVYSWVDQPGDIYTQPCNSDQLNFTWTYTPASLDPLAIQWTKQNAGGSFTAVATFGGGTFNPDSAYTGRVVRLGSTAELGLLNPTSADDGTYRVSVTDGNGDPLTSKDVVVSSIITANSSGIDATCGADGKTVTCAGVTTLGIPGATITLSYGSFSKDNGGIQTTVSKVMASRETVTCTLSGAATECLGAGVTKNASIECGQPPPTTTGTTITTVRPDKRKPPTIVIIVVCVVVIVIIIIIIIIIIICVRRNRRKKEGNDDANNLKLKDVELEKT